MIDYFYKKLINLKDLKPNKETNEAFSELCKYTQENDKDIEINEKILKINEICSKAEFEMEKFWSEKILKSQNPKQELKKFWYYENYKKLTKLEFLNSSFLQENISEILFIGWWPLPLTAIILAEDFWINSKIIDLSEEAIVMWKNLIKKLWLEDKIIFEKKNILDYKDEKKYDLVYAASLIFWNDNQEEIIKNIKNNLNFSKLLVRTSDWVRQILYKKTDENILKKYFKKELIVHPKNDIINSFIILTKK